MPVPPDPRNIITIIMIWFGRWHLLNKCQPLSIPTDEGAGVL